MSKFKWRNIRIENIGRLIPVPTNINIEKAKAKFKTLL